MNSLKEYETTAAQDLENVDLYEEEISAEKHLRDIGDVRLNKRVVTTQKTISIPVMHEEVVVERIPYDKPVQGKLSETPSSFEGIEVPLCEEEASAEKFTRPLGEVRLHKRIVTTKKQITVPVMHEEIRVEHVPAERKPLAYATGMFEESTQVIPLHDEEVQIHKYPVVREGVRVKKTVLQEERSATADLRREELDIEEPKTNGMGWKETRTPREFTEGIQSIPLYEEEIEVRKFPVLREVVRVNRAALQEDHTATTETLKEELEVEEPALFKERYRRL